jgi:RNA polymerase sigma-70 factor (ECF subfamily)
LPETSTKAAEIPDETALFARFASRIRLYGLRHLGDADAAEDLVQEVLLTTILKLRAGEIHQLDRLPSFVLGTCRMLASNERRGDRRRAALLEANADAAKPIQPPEPLHPIDARRLAHCLDALSERARAVLLMTFYAEQSSRELAEELRTSTENVRVLRHRAVSALRGCMTSEGSS